MVTGLRKPDNEPWSNLQKLFLNAPISLSPHMRSDISMFPDNTQVQVRWLYLLGDEIVLNAKPASAAYVRSDAGAATQSEVIEKWKKDYVNYLAYIEKKGRKESPPWFPRDGLLLVSQSPDLDKLKPKEVVFILSTVR